MKVFTSKVFAVCLAAVSILSASCASGEPRGVGVFDVRDSSGVEIVRSGPPNAFAEVVWTVADEPVLQIGKVEGDPAYLFESVSSAVMIPDGRTVVSDGRALDVRMFGPDGTHQLTFGRRGEGPLEFSGRPILALVPPDTLLIWDPGNFRLSWVDPSGSLVRERSLTATVSKLSLDLGANAWLVRPNGRLLWTGPPLGGMFEGVRRFVLITSERNLTHDFGIHPNGESIRLSSAPIYVPDWFAPIAHGALSSDGSTIAISSSEAWEIRFFSPEGELLRILRPSVSRTPVSSEVRAQRRNYLQQLTTRVRLGPAEGEKIEKQLPVPDSLPAIGVLIWDRVGNLWIGRRNADPYQTETFYVFGPDNRWLSTVHFPSERGRILDIGDDFVMASWHDGQGVPYLRIYRIEKSQT